MYRTFQRNQPTAKPPYVLGQTFAFTPDQVVICNGYPGRISQILTGELEGMVEVKLASGYVCVSACYPNCYPVA